MNYSEDILERAQQTNEQCFIDIIPLPSPDEFGQVRLSYIELREICQQRFKMGWTRGVFDAFASVSLDNKKSLTKPKS